MRPSPALLSRIDQTLARWRIRPRTRIGDLTRAHILPPLVAILGIGGAVAYFAAAIGGFTDIAGHHDRLKSALSGLVCLAIGLPVGVYVVMWLMRPEEPKGPTLRELYRGKFRGEPIPAQQARHRWYPPLAPDATRWQRITYWLKTN